ncbi:MAG: general secretion pathway protein GspK [Methylacidiphilales bacterium]|nr:general secretion pathway protein GspK [Candidatus Methylacidiphilales bacterium]MDW8350028.1 type II secretion system protein GspK [Verrucomicrobiae bacterium]
MKSFLSFRPYKTTRSGVALLLVIWAVAIMSITVLGIVRLIEFNLDDESSRNIEFRARQLAESGLSVGLHPDIKPGDPLLQQTFGPNESFTVTIQAETSKININKVLLEQAATAEEQFSQSNILVDLFASWEVPAMTALSIIACLKDWVDSDSLKNINGAEAPDYQARGLPVEPTNRPFTSVDEMEFVMGIEELNAYNPNWKEAFTVFGDGKIDVNEAPADVLALIFDLPQEQIDSFIRLRLGPDQTPHTKDDLRFNNIEELKSVLYIPTNPPQKYQQILNRITFNSTVWRIESEGIVNNNSKRILLIAQREQRPPVWLAWKEWPISKR